MYARVALSIWYVAICVVRSMPIADSVQRVQGVAAGRACRGAQCPRVRVWRVGCGLGRACVGCGVGGRGAGEAGCSPCCLLPRCGGLAAGQSPESECGDAWCGEGESYRYLHVYTCVLLQTLKRIDKSRCFRATDVPQPLCPGGKREQERGPRQLGKKQGGLTTVCIANRAS